MTRRIVDRRRFLKAMGLGGMLAGYGSLLSSRGARAEPGVPPKRVVFLVSSHGHVWNGWHMPMPGAPTDTVAEMSLHDMAESELSPTLQPLYPMRDHLTAIEGLCHTSVLAEFASFDVTADLNNHSLSYAHLLTNVFASQPGGGARCRGGGRSIDQVLGDRTGGPGRFNALTWDTVDDLPLRYQREYSYADVGRATPFESDPSRAYADLLGLYIPPETELTRADLLRASRLGAIDAARESYDRVIPHLGVEGQRKMEQHRDLLADLERTRSLDVPRLCNPAFESRGHVTEQFMRLATMALACDMTRVITLVMPILKAEDFGYDAGLDVHGDLAHASIRGGSAPYTMLGEQGMIAYNRWYATRIADFLAQLDAIPEAGGTLLDNTAVVWLSEQATPTHQHKDACTVLAGGSNFFQHGRYVRYPRDIRGLVRPPEGEVGPDQLVTYATMLGPATAHLLVSLMQYMGFDDDSFGLPEVTRYDGTTLDLRGPLSFLHV